MTGFVAAEGCFFVGIRKYSNYKTGSQVVLEFTVCQHVRDKQLIKSFVSWFGCGKINQNPKLTLVAYRVYKFTDVNSIIIPYFKKYLLVGNKFQYFQDFCKVAEIMHKEGHLNPEGLEHPNKSWDECQKIFVKVDGLEFFTRSMPCMFSWFGID